MFMNKRKAVGVALLMLGTGAAVMAYQGSRQLGTTSTRRVVDVAPSNDVTDWVAGWPDLAITPENDPKNKAILEALQKPIPMHFPNETPLREVISYVRKATEGPDCAEGLHHLRRSDRIAGRRQDDGRYRRWTWRTSPQDRRCGCS